jgi:UDP-N-acetylmuramate: L-alanyl-gamma-D-glutamyl-meso-diaminopimelate ligase
MKIDKDKHIYFLGVGGTGMSSVAGLCQEAGFKVSGSDKGVYPPVSTLLSDLGINVISPYSVENIKKLSPDLIVVANVLSRGNEEIEYMLTEGIPKTSFPKLLSDVFLQDNFPAVVAGTHGKTTTCSLLAHILNETNQDPSFFIGGVPQNFPRGFRLGKGKVFILEGDEYDTAFFDKGPKFLHYKPEFLILNNCEFDHADIYENVEAIEVRFKELIALAKHPKSIIANMDDAGINRIITSLGIEDAVTTVATKGEYKDCDFSVLSYKAEANGAADQTWKAKLKTKLWGDLEISTSLSGRHNLANICQVVACLSSMIERKVIDNIFADDICSAIESFASVKRRLDHLGTANGIDIYEDFAHHPTAIATVIEGFKLAYPDKTLCVAFEPRSAIQRRNIFIKEYAQVLSMADRVYIGELFVDTRIPEDERMNIEKLTADIGEKAKSFSSNQELSACLKNELHKGEAVIFMSSGSFGGVQYKLVEQLSE